MPFTVLVAFLHLIQIHASFPRGPVAGEEIALRWLHFIFGIIWIGLLYFFNLVGFKTMGELDPAVRAKVFSPMMARAMWWFRWSALVTVIAGLRYFWLLLAADATNAGNSFLALGWFGKWLVVWLIAYGLIYFLQLPRSGAWGSNWLRAVGIAIAVVVASYATLVSSGGTEASNAHLSIAVGGGIGLLMLLNTWGVVWRVQKRLIIWTCAKVEQGTPMPPEADRMSLWSYIASRTGFWLSFPMLFFMAAAEHYPFLSALPK